MPRQRHPRFWIGLLIGTVAFFAILVMIFWVFFERWPR